MAREGVAEGSVANLDAQVRAIETLLSKEPKRLFQVVDKTGQKHFIGFNTDGAVVVRFIDYDRSRREIPLKDALRKGDFSFAPNTLDVLDRLLAQEPAAPVTPGTTRAETLAVSPVTGAFEGVLGNVVTPGGSEVSATVEATETPVVAVVAKKTEAPEPQSLYLGELFDGSTHPSSAGIATVLHRHSGVILSVYHRESGQSHQLGLNGQGEPVVIVPSPLRGGSPSRVLWEGRAYQYDLRPPAAVAENAASSDGAATPVTSAGAPAEVKSPETAVEARRIVPTEVESLRAFLRQRSQDRLPPLKVLKPDGADLYLTVNHLGDFCSQEGFNKREFKGHVTDLAFTPDSGKLFDAYVAEKTTAEQKGKEELKSAEKEAARRAAERFAESSVTGMLSKKPSPETPPTSPGVAPTTGSSATLLKK